MSTTIQSLRNEFIRRQQASPSPPSSHFVPADAIAALIRFSSVKSVLEELRVSGHDVDWYTQYILTSAMKIFAILVYIGEVNEICRLLEEGFSDLSLPLCLNTDSTTSFPDGVQTVNGSVSTVSQWTLAARRDFQQCQWMFLSPFFDTVGQHMELDDHCVLPFIDEEVIRSEEGRTTILAVKIHRAHQRLCKPYGVCTSSYPLHRSPF